MIKDQNLMVHKELLSLFRTMLIIRHTEEELARCHQRGLILALAILMLVKKQYPQAFVLI